MDGWLGHNLNESKVADVRCVEFGCGRTLAPREQRLQEAGPRLGRPEPVELQGLKANMGTPVVLLLKRTTILNEGHTFIFKCDEDFSWLRR